MKIQWLGIIILLTSIPISYAEEVESYYDDQPYNWEIADPKDYGFETSSMSSITAGLSRHRSALVVRDEKLIYELYLGEGNMNTAYNVHSVSKSIISALVGIAMDQGLIESLDNKMLDYFPEYVTDTIDSRKWDITIKHLLTMNAGIEFYEGDGDLWTRYGTSENHVKYIIELPLLYDPGTTFFYSSAQTHLLSAILTKASGMSTYDFAVQNLFDPLGVTIDHWPQDPQGIYRGGHDFWITPRDMARFGFLYLNNGKIGDAQIVPKAWVEASTMDQGNGYGYLWWLDSTYGRDGQVVESYVAGGLGGQNIFVVSELNTIVVTTAIVPDFVPYPSQGEDSKKIYDNVIANLDPDFDTVTLSETDDDSSQLPFQITWIEFSLLLLILPLFRKKQR